MSSLVHEHTPVQEQTLIHAADRNNALESERNSDINEAEHVSHVDPSEVLPQAGLPRNSHDSELLHDYAADLAASRVGRSSRASSIFSTRTRLSNLTLDDARSIEIIAGGQSFRISRDGSRVTDVTAPPPYPGPPHEAINEDEQDMDNYVDLSSQSGLSSTEETDQQTPRLLPFQPSSNEEIEQELLTSTTPRLDLSSSVFEIPAKLKRALGVSSVTSSPSIPKFSVNSNPVEPPAHPRRTLSDTSNYAWFRPWSRASTENLASANKNLHDASQKVKEGDTSTTLPTSNSSQRLYNANDGLTGMGSNFDSHKRGYSHRSLPEQLDLASSTGTIEESEEDDYEDEDDERAAEISSHYSQVMRDLDREHRRKLHERDKELSQLRQLLHEKDIVYRQQLRDKDLIVEGFRSQSELKDSLIESLKHQLAQVEEGLETKLEQARNLVEDMWEKRWKTHEKLLLERLKQSNSNEGKQDLWEQLVLEESRAAFEKQYKLLAASPNTNELRIKYLK